MCFSLLNLTKEFFVFEKEKTKAVNNKPRYSSKNFEIVDDFLNPQDRQVKTITLVFTAKFNEKRFFDVNILRKFLLVT